MRIIGNKIQFAFNLEELEIIVERDLIGDIVSLLSQLEGSMEEEVQDEINFEDAMEMIEEIFGIGLGKEKEIIKNYSREDRHITELFKILLDNDSLYYI